MEATLERPARATTAKRPARAAAAEMPARVGAHKTQDAQLNVRMSRELKQAGDAVFAELGMGPSEAVRMLYEFSVSHANDPEAITRALSTETDEERAEHDAQVAAKLEAIRASRARIDAMFRDFGYTSTPSSLVGKSDDEILDEYYGEKLKEWGFE